MDSSQIVTSQRLAGLVERYHTWPTLRRQNNAEHSWQIMRIYCQLFGSPRSEVWYYILHHDSGEIGVGDLPFPVKSKDPDLKMRIDHAENQSRLSMSVMLPVLESGEKRRVKICDLLEMWEFGWEEEVRGNRLAEPITHDTYEALRGMLAVSFESEWNLVTEHMGSLAWMIK